MKKPSLLVGLIIVACVACTSSGCAVDLVGTGSDPAPKNNNPNAPPPSGSGTGIGELPAPATPTASGAPVEIEALFAPPTTDTVTPDSLFGVWAGTNSDADERIKFEATSLTIAKKCKADGRIAFVYVKVRATDSKVTILESKRAKLETTPGASANGYCSISLELVVGEWNNCATSNVYSCFSIEGTKLQGLGSQLSETGITSSSWLKLSD